MGKPIRQRDKWRIRWVDATGLRKSEVYDRHEDARFALARHEAQTEEVRRGLRDITAPQKTFDELFDRWLSHKAPLKRNEQDDKSIIRAHLSPHFSGKLLSDLKGSDIDTFKIAKGHLTAKTVSNHLTLLITMLNMAVEEGWIRKYPKIRKPKVSIFSKEYSFLKTDCEIQRFLLAARNQDEMVFVMYATAIYTGMRQGEIAGLEWSDIDFESRRITVQRSFDGPTKNGQIRRVPILDVLLPILRSWRLKNPSRVVFTNRKGSMFGESSRIFQETLHRTLDSAGFPMIERHSKPRRYIVFHDLRHTFASHWMMTGGDLFKLRDILGHQSIEMTQRYSHLSPHVFDADYDRFNSLVPQDAGLILPFVSHIK